MGAVYAVISLVGVGFLAMALAASPVQIKTVVQSLIFIALGGGGLLVNRRARHP